MKPNQAAAVNAPIAFWFQFGHSWRRVTEQRRYAAATQENMIAPEHFEVMEGYCCYRLSGQGPLAEAAGKVIQAIDYSREQKMRNLLIDTTNWTGHESPDIWERFRWAEAFADAARSTVKLAMVVRPEMMDPDKFEATVARNRGLMGNVFDSEKDALAWLLAPTV